MALVWGTAQDHSGYIHVESIEGKGSAFELYFPVSRETLIRNPGNVTIEDYMGNGESILVVDDMPEQRAVIARGFAENDRVREVPSLGAGPYIRKPYTLEKIGFAVKNELMRR